LAVLLITKELYVHRALLNPLISISLVKEVPPLELIAILMKSGASTPEASDVGLKKFLEATLNLKMCELLELRTLFSNFRVSLSTAELPVPNPEKKKLLVGEFEVKFKVPTFILFTSQTLFQLEVSALLKATNVVHGWEKSSKEKSKNDRRNKMFFTAFSYK
jgi:hypothetical protein